MVTAYCSNLTCKHWNEPVEVPVYKATEFEPSDWVYDTCRTCGSSFASAPINVDLIVSNILDECFEYWQPKKVDERSLMRVILDELRWQEKQEEALERERKLLMAAFASRQLSDS